MKSKLLMLALAAGVAASALLAAAPASATIHFAFDPGLASPSAGYTVINDFSIDSGITDGLNYKIMSGSDSTGALPGDEASTDAPYLSVLGGGHATLLFGPVSSFEFNWGSVDAYNTLTIHSSDGNLDLFPGVTFSNPADGNQVLPGTNGLFRVWGTGTTTFSGITLASGTNSFEIDNLAIPGGVPEPASWALMIAGFGMAGGLLRAKRRKLAFA